MQQRKLGQLGTPTSAVGYGAASKEQIQHMILRLLNIRKVLQEDEADALAVALCHAHSNLSAQAKSLKANT